MVFTHLSPKQRKMYEVFLAGGMISSVLSGETPSPLTAISYLKQLCGHPCLLKDASLDYYDCEVKDLLEDSAKLQVLYSLIHRLKRARHRTLVFSQSTKMLDIMEKVFKSDDVSFLRIDGKTAEKSRQQKVDAFNDKESNVDIMLLSTKGEFHWIDFI